MSGKGDFAVYEVPKKGRRYFMVRFKEDGRWISKYAPSTLSSVQEVEAWFPQWRIAERVQKGELRRRIAVEHPGVKVDFTSVKQMTLTVPTGYRGKPTLRNLSEWWLQYRKSDPNFRDFKGHLANWVLAHAIAKRPIAELEPVECRAWIRSIDRAPLTVRNVVATVRTLIDDARKEGKVPFRTLNLFRDKSIVSAIANGKTIAKKHGDENIVTLTDEQFAALVACANAKRRTLYTVALATGLRSSELRMPPVGGYRFPKANPSRRETVEPQSGPRWSRWQTCALREATEEEQLPHDAASPEGCGGASPVARLARSRRARDRVHLGPPGPPCRKATRRLDHGWRKAIGTLGMGG